MTDSRLRAEVQELKREKRALVLAHNYQPAEVYDVADFIGDSLELARQAAASPAPVIVFCGVRFMAETAKLLNPDSRVVLAEPRAGCQMADMITAEALRAKKAELGNPTVVAYVNTPAEVKAESDICCTSANAVKVVDSLPSDSRILFVPDRNLARYVARTTGREITPWEGFCYVHAFFTLRDVVRARQEHPEAKVVAHPECPLDVIEAADSVASTSGMVRLAREFPELVLGTEAGMCNRIRRDLPNTRCFPLARTAVCRNMKLTSLEKVRDALAGRVEEVVVPDDTATRARATIEKMMLLS